ncbi:twin-arginine translocation signal domain-containing protein [Kaarinaea lacus]
MNKKQASHPKSERRNFLKGVVIAGGATALTSVSAGLLTESNAKEKRANAKTRASKGYHETPHIQAYYQSLRN